MSLSCPSTPSSSPCCHPLRCGTQHPEGPHCTPSTNARRKRGRSRGLLSEGEEPGNAAEGMGQKKRSSTAYFSRVMTLWGNVPWDQHIITQPQKQEAKTLVPPLPHTCFARRVASPPWLLSLFPVDFVSQALKTYNVDCIQKQRPSLHWCHRIV